MHGKHYHTRNMASPIMPISHILPNQIMLDLLIYLILLIFSLESETPSQHYKSLKRFICYKKLKSDYFASPCYSEAKIEK